MGVVPRLLRPGGTGGSMDVFRGVCIPDGVDVPLKLRLYCVDIGKENKFD